MASDPFSSDDLKDPWFSQEAPTRKPPRLSSNAPPMRIPSAPPPPAFEEAEVDDWFI